MLLRDYVNFLKEYNLVGLAVGVVMGTATTALVNSLVKDLVMPLLSPLLPANDWQNAAWHFHSITLDYGPFLAEALNFVIFGLVVFLIVRKLLKMQGVK